MRRAFQPQQKIPNICCKSDVVNNPTAIVFKRFVPRQSDLRDTHPQFPQLWARPFTENIIYPFHTCVLRGCELEADPFVQGCQSVPAEMKRSKSFAPM